MENETEARINKATQTLDKTISEVRSDADTYTVQASRQKTAHTVFRAALAILGVATPALVTYQTQVADPVFKLLAILLAAIAGAAATLQATFSWGDHYGRSQLTALSLQELDDKLSQRRDYILESTDRFRVYSEICALSEYGSRKRREILRNHIEGEVAIVTRKSETDAESDERLFGASHSLEPPTPSAARVRS